MSNITGDGGGSFSSGTGEEVQQQQSVNNNHFQGSNSGPSTATNSNGSTSLQQPPVKKKRNLPGTPDPDAEVIALSPTTLMARNRFVCEICNKGFQRDQNLQLHRRGHNLPWKLRQRSTTDIRKRVYICPEPTCVHHNPARALGDLTGIKKHFSRKHGEKKWKCDKCSKRYAVQSDWKAHSKTCGTREYKCDCGTIFSRRDSFITHRAFCDALAEENNRAANQGLVTSIGGNMQDQVSNILSIIPNSNMNNQSGPISDFDLKNSMKPLSHELMPMPLRPLNMGQGMLSCSSGTLFGGPRSVASSSSCLQLSSNSSSNFTGHHDQQLITSANMSATALLQKAAQMGATASNNANTSPMMQKNFGSNMVGSDQFSGISRPLSSYGGGLQHNNNSYHNIQSQTDQLQLLGMDGGLNRQFLPRGRQEISPHCFDVAVGADNSSVNDVGMFSGMYMNGNHLDHGFLKNIEHESTVTTSTLQGRSPAVNSSLDHHIPASGQDMMTVDFLGMGGSSRAANLHQHQQEMEFEAISEPKLQSSDPFSYGHAVMEKPMWDA
ncbi:indeterminate-domain [Thalictrum thalictroides]|uniref:Indeterminate-domain n=1 Tax=Thalictrum thalictroides TaxID=46969 RepID=A0A7J6VIM5_THATH|nr:indeterminate-domain [Thalictrum thalictroides]